MSRVWDFSRSRKARPFGSPPLLMTFCSFFASDADSDISFRPPTAYSASQESPWP
jgi:hypothetical protein